MIVAYFLCSECFIFQVTVTTITPSVTDGCSGILTRGTTVKIPTTSMGLAATLVSTVWFCHHH